MGQFLPNMLGTYLKKCHYFIAKTKEELTYRKLQDYENFYIDFASNDYLGLSQNEEVLQTGIKAAMKYGAGSTGSRLLSGNKQIFCEFEEIIARDKMTESSLIFNSGFQLNSGALECLTDKNTTVIFDKLNHASMYQGVFASGAKLMRFNHLNYDHLESILKNETTKNIIIVSETVFGMDGDIADLQVLSDLSNKYGTLLYLDEAHATGLYGKEGYGLSTNFKLNPETTIVMGTFSKALGSSGAYIACSNLIKDFLVQCCRSFIYSTALSPFCIGAAMASWKLVKCMSEIRKDLLNKADNLREELKSIGRQTIGNRTNIIPILCKSTESMRRTKEKCFENEVIVSGIAKPTSPIPRIRIALNAKHSNKEIKKLVECLKS